MRTTWSGSLLALLLSACGHAAPESEPKPAAGSELPVVTLDRTACMGRCPVYSVTIDRGGTVKFDGKQFVQHAGPHMATIPAVMVDSLVAELSAGGLFDMADRYTYGASACGRYATDLPSALVTVTQPERSKRIEHDYGCTDAPAELARLERRIDDVAGTSIWVGER